MSHDNTYFTCNLIASFGNKGSVDIKRYAGACTHYIEPNGYIKLAVTDAVQDQVSIGVLSINNQIQKNK